MSASFPVRYLPPFLRRLVARSAKHWLAKVPDANRCRVGAPTVVGLFNAPSGLGQSARTCLASLSRLGFRPTAYDVTKTFNPHYEAGATRNRFPMGEKAQGPLLVHMNPPESSPALLKAWMANRAPRYRVGVWHWELPIAPPQWRSHAEAFNEIWAPSSFVKEALERSDIGNVRIVPHPVATPMVEAKREDYGLAEGKFIVLSMLDLNSFIERKNPRAVIEAFRQAFGDDPQAQLILKVTSANMRGEEFQRLKAFTEGFGNIELMTKVLPEEGVRGLMSVCDVLISLHRSEGFGLTLAEAMTQRVPTIATGWSGNMDFMDSRNSCLVDYRLVPVPRDLEVYGGLGAHWAEPSSEHAALWLRKLADDRLFARSLADAAEKTAKEAFSLERYALRVEASLGRFLEKP